MREAVYIKADQLLASEQVSMPQTRSGDRVGAVRCSGVYDADCNYEMTDSSRMVTGTVGFDDFTRTFESLRSDKSACKMTLAP